MLSFGLAGLHQLVSSIREHSTSRTRTPKLSTTPDFAVHADNRWTVSVDDMADSAHLDSLDWVSWTA